MTTVSPIRDQYANELYDVTGRINDTQPITIVSYNNDNIINISVIPWDFILKVH